LVQGTDSISYSESPIIARATAVSRTQESTEPDDVAIIDEPEKRCLSQRLRRVRRKPGLEYLGSQEHGPAVPPSRRYGHNRTNTWATNWNETTIILPRSDSAPLLQSTQRHDAERRNYELEKKRAMWESTLPPVLSDHIGYFPTGHNLDRVSPDGKS